MTPPELSLKRLLEPSAARRLLAAFAGAQPGSRCVVLDLEGGAVSRHRLSDPAAERLAERAGAFIRSSPSASLSPEPVCLEGAACYPLLVEQQNLGWLVADAPSPVWAALQAALSLHLTEQLEKRSLARETLERYREINLLYHLADRFASSLEAGEILQIALRETRRVIQADSGAAWISGSGILSGAQEAQFGSPAQVQALMAFLRGLARGDLEGSGPDIVTGRTETGQPFGSILYAPLMIGGSPAGMLALERELGQPEFTAGDEKLLLALAGMARGAVEKAVLHQQDLRHQRTAQELAIGQRIQVSLLPKSMPSVPGWEFAASYQAANQVGGDFYDIFPLLDETGCQDMLHYGLTMADVTGEGIPAALMMAFSQGILHTAAFSYRRPCDVLYHTNQSILQSSHTGLLLTAFYGVLDPCAGSLTYANGGHEPPILYRAASGAAQELECGRSLLLGMRRQQPYQDAAVQLQPGDVLLLYTDGVTEARGPTGDFFSEERLYAAVNEHASRGCQALLAALLQSLEEFTAGTPQSDDITMLALRRLS